MGPFFVFEAISTQLVYIPSCYNIAPLALVGFKDVLDHVAIKQHPIFHHGVAGNGPSDKKRA